MSTDTPETPVAATPPTPESVAEMFTEGDNDFHDGNNWKPSLSSVGNVVHIRITPYSEPDEDDLDDEAVELDDVHFRAVVVEGEETPLVLERPAELGLSWDDGGDLLSFDNGIIRLTPRGVDEWELSPEEALELAGQLAAMATLGTRGDLEGVAFGDTRLVAQDGGVR